MKNLLLVSSSRYSHNPLLAHCLDQVKEIFSGIEQVLFIPYARPGGMEYDAYTATYATAFESIGKTLTGIHVFNSPVDAISEAQAIFIGGGNTFLLLKGMIENGLIEPIRKKVLNGTPYMGTSAGSNVAGLTIGSSNDMPIVFPSSFDALQLVPFNINPHYPAETNSKDSHNHMGESRDQRLDEFTTFNKQPVLAIREDGMLLVKGDSIELIGKSTAKIFSHSKDTIEIKPGQVSGLN